MRALPNYSRAEEIANSITHGIGILFGIVCLALCTGKALAGSNPYAIVTGIIYGVSMIAVYTISTVYHGFPVGTGKKVMQVLDHCTIYTLIAGTYTPIVLCGIAPQAPWLGWGLFLFQWVSAAVAITLNAIDLKMFKPFSMTAYIVMGWSIIVFAPKVISIIGAESFLFILGGGISYTLGAILFAIGAKRPWFHSVFHVFVVLGSILQFLGIYLYIL